jgi:hypothetical protein
MTQGSSCLATLIDVPKLFNGGEERLWNLSPQPTVNNFARHPKSICEQLPPSRKACGHAALDDEFATRLTRRVSPELRSSAALGLKTNTQMPTVGCLRYKAFAEPKPACP